MRIKKLELIGFKSFKDRTVIQFDEGITGVVGPNGCGKSNIVDALVWVMGEQSAKHLRGSSMEDVIFAGADGYAPMGMAEVSLTLENSGGPFPLKYSRFSEVMITRRLYRSGDSEYLINKEPARLKDVHEIFMDTGAGSKGFSIIEQGAIGKIITAKPQDRRVLIEEAAGITKFKVRKRESQRKLVATDQNLVRLQDIIGEQKRQLDSLQRQAQRAEKFRDLKNQMREKDLWLSSRNYQAIRQEMQGALDRLEEIKGLEVHVSSDLSIKEAELQSLKLELAEREAQIEQTERSLEQLNLELKKVENEIRELKFEVEQARRDREMTGNVVEQYRAREQALRADHEDVNSKWQAASEAAEKLMVAYQEVKDRFQIVQKEIQEMDDDLTRKRREMLTVSQSESHMEARQLSLQESQENLGVQLENQRQVMGELQEQKKEFESRRNTVFSQLEGERQLHLGIQQNLDTTEQNLLGVKSQLEQKLKEQALIKDELNQVSSQLHALEQLQNSFEGFEEGTRQVMLWQQRRAEQSPDGQVSFQSMNELVEVPSDYELAFEAAVGEKLQLLVASESQPVIEALEYLKAEKGGRSHFYSPEWQGLSQDKALIKSQVEAARVESGVVSSLLEVVKPAQAYGEVLAFFLSDIVIVDQISTALRLRPRYPGLRFVTLDGDHLSQDGVLTGGTSEGADSGLLKRKREIKELMLKKEELSGKLALISASITKVEKLVHGLEADLKHLTEEQTQKEQVLASLQRDLDRAELELRNVTTAVTRQEGDLNRLESQEQKLQADHAELEQRLIESREKRQELEQTCQELEVGVRERRSGVEDLQTQVSQLGAESAARKQEAAGLRSQLDSLDKNLREVEEQLSSMSEKSEKSHESLTSNQILVQEKQVEFERRIREVESLKAQFALERDEFESRDELARELEAFVSKSLHEINQHQNKVSEAQLKIEQLKMKEQYLLTQVEERYSLALEEIYQQHLEGEFDPDVLAKEIEELKAKLSKIGDVNLSAIREFEELSERYEFLSKQYQDLQDAKEQLRKVIDRINRICSKRFKETFDQVNERFMKVFPVLFGGGEAQLILVEDEEKGEMGIDIVAKPPGKKSQNVSLLSGGEKALTAVSLIFSIFLVKPSPFCLLDEVDAPLDDANVFRFNDLVKEMAKRSQVIIVTHNKHTMRVNNKLYGVTQEEKGVSKMVSVALDQVG